MLTSSIAAQAQKLGFTAASSAGVDDVYFQKFRDLGKVDEKQFDALMAARAAEEPPPAGSGVVAVECNGYAAGRGSGWVSWQPPNPGGAAVVVRFPKNKTGLHVVELQAVSNKSSFVGFAQVSVQRFDLYKDTEKESKRWAAWVSGLPLGRVVCVCITDTAMAKTRPLPPAVYDALRALGAPPSLTLIGYREPFAFVGACGLAPGTAAAALDPKKQSKTLLRVHATLALGSSTASAASASVVPAGKGKAKAAAASGAAVHMCAWHVGEVGLLHALDSGTTSKAKNSSTPVGSTPSGESSGTGSSSTIPVAVKGALLVADAKAARARPRAAAGGAKLAAGLIAMATAGTGEKRKRQ
jgi:hypothetical protein